MAIPAKNFSLLLLFFLAASSVSAFYLPGSYPHNHNPNSFLFVKVNSLTSIDTELYYSYYTLPFCRPQDGIKDSTEHLGELLMGDWIESSPYRFRMLQNESDLFLSQTNKLRKDDYIIFTKRIDEMYQVNVILDNLQFTFSSIRWYGCNLHFVFGTTDNLQLIIHFWYGCNLHFLLFSELLSLQSEEFKWARIFHFVTWVFPFHGFGYNACYRHGWVPFFFLVCHYLFFSASCSNLFAASSGFSIGFTIATQRGNITCVVVRLLVADNASSAKDNHSGANDNNNGDANKNENDIDVPSKPH